MAALATVLQRPIASVYPPVNGLCDRAFRELTCTMHPLRQALSDAPIYVMWSCTAQQDTQQLWAPNHFVPLLHCTSDMPAITVSDDDQNPVVNASTDTVVSSPHSAAFADSDFEAMGAAAIQPEATSTPANQPRTVSTVVQVATTTGVPLSRHFLDGYAVLNVLFSENPMLPAVPNGIKENVYFIMNNSCNTMSRHDSKQSSFADDCGIWDTAKGSTKKHEFILTDSGNIRFIEKHQGQYYTNRKNPATVLVPQPEQKDVHILKRYYATLKRDSTFRKRVS